MASEEENEAPMIVDGDETADPPVAEIPKNPGAEDFVSPLGQEGMKLTSSSRSRKVPPNDRTVAPRLGVVRSSPPAKRIRTYSVEECERRVQASYKKLKREAERRFGVDSLGRRNPPAPREATPVPNVYRSASVSTSAPPAPTAAAAAVSRPRNVYEGGSVRGSAARGSSSRGGGASYAVTDPRWGYAPLSFARGRRGTAANAKSPSSSKVPSPHDSRLGYSGIAYRRPTEGRGADPRFHIFDLDASPRGDGVSVRRAATEPMTYRRPGSDDDEEAVTRHEANARGRPGAARRLNFDPRLVRNNHRRQVPPLQPEEEKDEYDNPNIPSMDDEDNGRGAGRVAAPTSGSGSQVKRAKTKKKASWDDVLEYDFDAFPPRDESSIWARSTSLLGKVLWTVGVIAAKWFAFVSWWIFMAVLAEYVVNNVIAPDMCGSQGSSSSTSTSSSPVLSPIVQHVAPWIPFQRSATSSLNRSILTSHPVSSFITDSFVDFGPIPRSFLYPAKAPASIAAEQQPSPTNDDKVNGASWMPSWSSMVWNGQWLCPYTLCTAPLASHHGDDDHRDGGHESDASHDADTIHEVDDAENDIEKAVHVGLGAGVVDDGIVDSRN